MTAAAAAGLLLKPSASAGLANVSPDLTMSTRPIPRTGELLPAIGMGTWQTFDVSGARALEGREAVLQAFLNAGGRVIDSSPMYGRAEAVVGELLPRVRASSPPFVATKVWTTGRDKGIAQMRASIRKMGGRVDLMQVHNLVDWREHLPTLRRWKDEGIIRYLGVTHYLRSAFDQLEAIIEHEAVDFVQLPYSLATRDAEARLLPCAERTGTAVLVMRPFEGGELFRRVKGRALPAWASELGCRSWAQVLLKFVLSHPAVTCPIPATSKLKHLHDNMQAGSGPLPDAAMRRRMIASLER